MQITIYTMEECFGCEEIKRWLDDRNMMYEELPLSEHPTGETTAPAVIVDGEEITPRQLCQRLLALDFE